MSFLNDLVGFKSKITLSHFAIGGFTLDAIVEEAFEASVTLTESAVESGARISEHKIRNPRAAVIRGTIVNYDIEDSFSQIFPQTDALFNNMQLPVSVSAVTEYSRATVNRYAGTVKKYAQAAKTAYGIYNKLGTIKSITDIPSLLNDNSATDDRITRIKNTLEALCFSEELLTVSTSGWQYTSVSLVSVSLTRIGNSAEVSIAFREVPTFSVETVSGINAVIKPVSKTAENKNKPATTNKAEKAKTQSAKPQNKGKTQPQKSKKSALKSIVDSAKGAF